MELELKHISPYLPYRLKYNDWDDNPQIINGVPDLDHVEYYCEKTDYGRQDYIGDIKPLLRPMSDLFENIVHNGEIVCVAKVIAERDDDLYFDEENNTIYDDQVGFDLVFNGETFPNIIAYWIVEILFKYHFDVFGLIEKGLAEPIKNK